MIKLPTLNETEIFGKAVFLRANLDVPLIQVISDKGQETRIEDDFRLLSAIPTIEYLLKNGAKIIIAGHLGRPSPIHNSEFIIHNSNREFSLLPVAEWFAKQLTINNLQLTKNGEFDGWQIGDNIFLLENLRFYAGEEKNDPEFSKKMAGLADIYVNDAFAMCHRNHASMVGITRFLPHFAGFHLQKEVENLTSAMENPKRPLVVIIGGKKIETKLPIVSKMHRIADYVLVGGKIVQESKELVRTQHEKITGRKAVLLIADSNQDKTDITEKDAENFLQIISLAKTIIWNGSMGIIGTKAQNLSSEKGTGKIAQGIINSGAYSIVGGGDTVEFLNKLGILNKFSFASTGGGAMLSFLSGEKLPGLEALL